MKNTTTYKSNITVFVGRSEQSDLRLLTFCRTVLRHLLMSLVGRSEQSDLRLLTFCRTDLRHLTFCRSDLRQIAKNKRYSFLSFFLYSKPVKITHKPRQKPQPDHNTVMIQLCKKRHKTVSF